MPHVACQQERQVKIRRVLPLYLAIVFAAGALIATQAGVNSQLTRAVGHPILAATISFLVGTAVLLAGSLGVVGSWTGLSAAAQAPWWAWTGGLLGAVFVVTMTWLAPTLGAATLLSVAIAGQVSFALVLDHYGLVGFPQRSLSPGRALGAGLLVVGVVMIRKC
jgi:bacterial/archaeal transporter family-2 protein